MSTETVPVPEEQHSFNASLQQLLSEVREQRREITSLKEEFRDNSLSVKSEVKRLKSDHELKWKFEGNKLQHDFNSSLFDNLKQVHWGLSNGKVEYAKDLVNECCNTLKKRNKHLRIADSSEGGWETVRQYESNPVASDSDDETRILRAESRAVRRKKSQQKSSKKSKPSATFSSADVFGSRHGSNVSSPGIPLWQPQAGPLQQQQQSLFRPYSYGIGTRGTAGPCFACGESTHFRRNCPYTRSAGGSDPSVKK